MAKKKYEFQTKRLITKKQEEVYRLCHQDFEGLTVEEAAEKLGIHPRKVYELLERMEKIAPQLFPILSKENAKIWGLWHVDGISFAGIADCVGLTEKAVIRRLERIQEKMGYHAVATANPHRAISLDTMDIDTVIIKKF